jgi:SAM-dependent methyltransferase
MARMSTMYEIYQRHRAEYDRLVEAEDHLHALPGFLHSLIDWPGRTVLEGGAGTGRVTEMIAAEARQVICLDLEAHMLEAARERLAPFSEKISYQVADNLDLPVLPEKADVFIEGWSWGHSIVDRPGTVEATAELLFTNIRKNLVPGGIVILIETLGTNQKDPAAPLARLGEFYQILQARYHMQQTVLATDYRFPSVREAADTLGFFFGNAMKQDILTANSPVIPEWTGVWHGRLLP